MSSVRDKPAETPDGEPAKKKVKFSSQVSVQEFHAHPAAETVVFHLLYSTTPAELEQEIARGGQPFQCEFYNQVSCDVIAGLQQVRIHACTVMAGSSVLHQRLLTMWCAHSIHVRDC
jgi:hypothetical protein